MRPRLVLILTIATAAVAWPTAASARTVELGRVANPATPACPTACNAIVHTTGFGVDADGRHNIFVVPRAGRITALTMTLGKPTKKQIQFFNARTGGPSRVRVTILRTFRRRNNNFRFFLNANSEDFLLQPYFGKTAQFPLRTSLKVKKGYVVAITVPTWAPALALGGLANGNTWRASRVKPCSPNTTKPPENQSPHLTPGKVKRYFCLYRPARLAYSVTLVSTP